MPRQTIEIIFRSFVLRLWWNNGAVEHIYWGGPKPWMEPIKVACKSWVKNDGFAGIDLGKYMDMLDIGRNNPKREQAEEK